MIAPRDFATATSGRVSSVSYLLCPNALAHPVGVRFESHRRGRRMGRWRSQVPQSGELHSVPAPDCLEPGPETRDAGAVEELRGEPSELVARAPGRTGGASLHDRLDRRLPASHLRHLTDQLVDVERVQGLGRTPETELARSRAFLPAYPSETVGRRIFRAAMTLWNREATTTSASAISVMMPSRLSALLTDTPAPGARPRRPASAISSARARSARSPITRVTVRPSSTSRVTSCAMCST